MTSRGQCSRGGVLVNVFTPPFRKSCIRAWTPPPFKNPGSAPDLCALSSSCQSCWCFCCRLRRRRCCCDAPLKSIFAHKRNLFSALVENFAFSTMPSSYRRTQFEKGHFGLGFLYYRRCTAISRITFRRL